MSIEALRWIRPLQVTPPMKAVLWALADNADEAGLCWPSMASLVEATCLGERTVQAAIKALVAADLLTIEQGGGRGRTTRYRLRIGARPAAKTPQDSRGCASATPQEMRGSGRHTPRLVRGNEGETPQQPHPEPPENTSQGNRHGGGRAARRAERGTRLSPDWWPDEAQRTFAADLGLEVDWVANQFRDHFLSRSGQAGVMLDWGAAWQVWCRRQVEFDRQRRGRAGGRGGKPANRLDWLETSIFDAPGGDEAGGGPILDMAAGG